MKHVLLTTPCAPFDTAWGQDTMDLLGSRLARGHDIANLRSELPTWGLYLIAENIESPSTVLEYPHWNDFMKELDKGYDVIGIQLKSLNTERTVRMVRAIRKHSPGTSIVLGGYGVGALNDRMPGDVNGNSQYLKDNVDHLCRQEGVRFMRELLGETPVDRPITQYHMPYARFHLPGVRAFSLNVPAILVSLGCPSACEFCNTSAFFRHKKIQVADPEQTYRFMKSHLQRLGVETLNVVLFDEDLFLDPDYVRELGRLIRSDRKMWGVRWISFGSIKALSAFEPQELRECGLGGVWVGVESGLCDDGHSRTGYTKRDGVKSPEQLFAELNRYGIETIGSMILGFDFHTPENIEQDIDYFVALKPMFYQIGPLTPCPGTKLFRQLEKAGRLFPHYNHEHFHLWKDDTFELAHFAPGEIKKYYDLAHEKLRTVNGPPALQFCEMHLSAHEVLRDADSEFLRHQAELARSLALGALPLVRAVGNNPPSPKVKQRVREIEARAAQVLGHPPAVQRVLGKALELAAGWSNTHTDPLDRKPPVSDPGARWMLFNEGVQKKPVRRGAHPRLPRARSVKGQAPGLPEMAGAARRQVRAVPARRLRLRVEEPVADAVENESVSPQARQVAKAR